MGTVCPLLYIVQNIQSHSHGDFGLMIFGFCDSFSGVYFLSTVAFGLSFLFMWHIHASYWQFKQPGSVVQKLGLIILVCQPITMMQKLFCDTFHFSTSKNKSNLD